LRALISVYDKTGLQEFARGLAELGFQLVASGGTADFLEQDVGLDVERVEELTGVAEMLGGRVKTLHPNIHAAILARRDHAEDVATLGDHDIRPFDLVCVNLYPFGEVADRYGVREEEAVEMIDVGGPSMLRGAAKNFAHVAPVCRPERYGSILAELQKKGDLSLETRRALAAETFATTAAYEAAIARWFGDVEAFPETLVTAFSKVTDLRYGENPHQRGAYYAEQGARVHLLSRVEHLHGKELSLINLLDLSAARLLLREFALPACAIIKHANPCGVAVAGTVEEAYERALASDPVSAFGMVCAVNRPVTAELGEALAERFIDVLFAPDYDNELSRRCSVRRRFGSCGIASGVGSHGVSATSSACSAACSSRIATGTSTIARRWRSPAVNRTKVAGATWSSPGGCASTWARTRLSLRRISQRSASAPARRAGSTR
jgi:phosphoribosylaminoimidazolecarboxamide formyltransferase/IMP cyclohydrolase